MSGAGCVSDRKEVIKIRCPHQFKELAPQLPYTVCYTKKCRDGCHWSKGKNFLLETPRLCWCQGKTPRGRRPGRTLYHWAVFACRHLPDPMFLRPAQDVATWLQSASKYRLSWMRHDLRYEPSPSQSETHWSSQMKLCSRLWVASCSSGTPQTCEWEWTPPAGLQGRWDPQENPLTLLHGRCIKLWVKFGITWRLHQLQHAFATQVGYPSEISTRHTGRADFPRKDIGLRETAREVEAVS